MDARLKEIAEVWTNVRSIFSVPDNEEEYHKLVVLLDSVIDEVGDNESHPLCSLTETLGSLIETYESRHLPDIDGNPIDAVKALMAEHNLKQSDLSELGSQGVVSEILSGKRQLNIRQARLLSERFKVASSVFI